MPALVIVGAQWGDEGKGKVVDLFTPFADVVVRYAGGANAGHTLVVAGQKLILHLIPSGILHEGRGCVIAQGTVLDPHVLLRELDALADRGVDASARLVVSERAHVVLPHHKVVDGLREQGEHALGTTKRGIGPTYEDKVGRRGVRIGDLVRPDTLLEKVTTLHAYWSPRVAVHGGALPEVSEVVETYLAYGERLAPLMTDTSRAVGDALAAGKKVLLEGAQGTLLDIDHGTYPFVTSSNSVSGGACASAGIGPTDIGAVVGIAKAYATRVGSGPFPTELDGEQGDALRTAGAEFGSTTGRPRRCGWLDTPALRFAARVNGMTEIALTKLDVLSGMAELQVCVAYELDGERLDEPTYDGMDRLVPVYETLPGWTEDITGCRSRSELPDNARRYVERIEELVGCPVGPVSVGADREQTADLQNPFRNL